jgi:putative resolvase
MLTLNEYSEKHRITYRTAWERFRNGKIANAFKDDGGKILIKDSVSDNALDYTQVAIYCRVSSNKQKEDLNSQVERVKQYCSAKGYLSNYIISEIASGVSDNRTKLVKLLKQDGWNTLVVEHKDRLTRFGFNYIEVLLNLMNKRIEVIHPSTDEKSDLVSDIISILYSFSARMYGIRRSKKSKIEKALECLK